MPEASLPAEDLPADSGTHSPATVAAATPPAAPQIEVLDERGRLVQTIALSSAGLAVGRRPGNDLVLDNNLVSRNHLRIAWDGRQATVTDLGARAGTLLAGKSLTPQRVEPWQAGQALQIGPFILRLRGAAPPPPAREAIPSAPALQQQPAAAGLLDLALAPGQAALDIAPGTPAAFDLLLTNYGADTDMVTVTVSGLPASWAAQPSQAVTIEPNTSASVRLLINVPRASESRPGEYPVTIRARSSAGPGSTYTAQLPVYVRPFLESSLALAPRQAHGQEQAVYTVQVTNHGNTPNTYNLSAADDEQLLEYSFIQPQLVVAPGQDAGTPLTVRAKRRLFGQPRQYEFTVQAAGEAAPSSVGGRFVQGPLLPIWVIPAALALLLFALLCAFAALPREFAAALPLYGALAPSHAPTNDPGATELALAQATAGAAQMTAAAAQLTKVAAQQTANAAPPSAQALAQATSNAASTVVAVAQGTAQASQATITAFPQPSPVSEEQTIAPTPEVSTQTATPPPTATTPATSTATATAATLTPTARPEDIPSAPIDLSITNIAQSTISLSWTDTSANETGFDIERLEDGASEWLTVNTVDADTESYEDADLDCETRFSYRVRARNNDIFSDYSNLASATTLSCALTATPTQTLTPQPPPAATPTQTLPPPPPASTPTKTLTPVPPSQTPVPPSETPVTPTATPETPTATVNTTNNKLVILAIWDGGRNGGSSSPPKVDEGFNVRVEVQDASGNQTKIQNDTDVTVTVSGGTGSLSGTQTITLNAGTGGTFVFTTLKYDKAENNLTLTVTSTSGDKLIPGTATFKVVPRP